MRHSAAVLATLSAVLAAPLSTTLASPLVMQAEKQWQEHDLLGALQSYNQTLETDAAHEPALQGRWRVLSKLGLHQEALAEVRRTLPANSSAMQTLHEDGAAQAIRWSEQEYYAIPKDRYPEADAALAMVQANMQRYPESLRSRWDWVRALSNRQRYAEAMAVYEGLLSATEPAPAYVHVSAGRAYLAEKKPDSATTAYQRALDAAPDNLDASLGLFYALSDQGLFSAANQHIKQVASKKLLPEQQFTAESTAIAGLAYAGYLDDAQNRLLQHQQEAPNSTALHIALGRIYMWRGWPERAYSELLSAAIRDRNDVRAQNALVELETVQGSYALADQRLARLEVIAPDDPDVKNLKRAQTLRQYNEVSVTVSGTRTKDSAGSSHGTVVDARFNAPPLDLQTRPFVHTYVENSTVDDISTEYQRLGFGVEHRIPRIGFVQAEVQQELNLEKQTSLVLGGTWNLNDTWSFDGQWDSNSVQVPLRARYDTISGWRAQVGAAYRAHEGATTQLNYAELHMSDQNLRQSVALQGNYTVLQQPSLKGKLGFELAASSNSVRNTAYFNPISDNTAQVSYTTEWMSFQSPNRSLRQQLVLAVGQYTQEGFDAAAIGSISYQHDWKLNEEAQLRYGVAFVRRVYDGLNSEGPEANLSINWRF